MIHIAPAWYAIFAVAAGGWMVLKYRSAPTQVQSSATTPTSAQTAPATSAATQAAPATPAPAPRTASPSFPWGGSVFALLLIAGAIAAIFYWKPVIGYFHSLDSTEAARVSTTPAPAPAAMPSKVAQAPSPQCPDFAFKVHNKCTFGDTVLRISTGLDGGALCIDRMPLSDDDFIIYNADGSKVTGSNPSAQSEQGFKAPPGQTRRIVYWKAPTPEECAKS